MTLPDQIPPRKPPSKVWLFAPFVVLAIVAGLWGVGWTVIRQRAFDAMDRQATALRTQGWQIGWSQRSLKGWPFRFQLELDGVKVVDPSGRGVSAPRFLALAYIYDLDRWVAYAPDGLTIERPVGAVAVKGRVLRAGLSGVRKGLMNLTLEGRDMAFTPQNAPFAFAKAERVMLSLRQGPDDQAALLFDGGGLTAGWGGLFAAIAGPTKSDLGLELILDKRSALKGASVPERLRAWSQAGGAAKVQKARLAQESGVLESHEGDLRLDEAGYVQGRILFDPKASKSLGFFVQSADDYEHGQPLKPEEAALVFDDHEVRLGPLPSFISPLKLF